jgi:type IV secretory pathway TrbF-like protein
MTTEPDYYLEKNPAAKEGGHLALGAMTPGDPYIAAQRIYNDRYASLALNARNWRLVGVAAAALLALSLVGNLVQAGQVKRLPYVVLADTRGYAITIPQPLTPASTTIDLGTIERYEVAAFVRSARDGAR